MSTQDHTARRPQIRFGEPLTDSQIADVQRVRDEWMQIGLSTERCNRPAAEAAVRAAYRAAGIEDPQVVVWMDSPLGGMLATAFVRELKSDQLGDQLWGQLRGQLRSQLWGQLDGPLRSQLWGQLGGHLRSHLRSQLWLGGHLRSHLRSQLGDQLGDQLGQEISPWWDCYWLACMTCALPLAGLDNSDRLDALADACRLTGWWWPMRGAAVLTDRPTTLRVDQLRRLHCEDGPALAYADGCTLHSWHGTTVPADLIETGWDIKRIMAEKNAEIRRCAIERYGWDRFVVGAHFTLADGCDDPGNPGQTLRLYDVPRKVLDLPVRVLVAHNATRERDGSRHTFGLTTPTDCKTAIEAAAWCFDVNADEYRTLLRAT